MIKLPRRLLGVLLVATATTTWSANAPIWLYTPGTNLISAPVGTQVFLRSVADASPAPAYSWLSNSTPVVGAITNYLWVTISQTTTNAKWFVVATNLLGKATNGPFNLRIAALSATSNTWGNVTGSGNNSVLDLIQLGRQINGTVSLSGVPLGLADVNQDGVIDSADQALVHNNILGRTNLAKVSQTIVEDVDNDSVPAWREWQQGLLQGQPDTDGDGVSDGQELADGTDPLNSTSLIPYGMYSSTASITIFNLTPNPADSGVFVATPPVTLTVP